jgi:hypothetical protein
MKKTFRIGEYVVGGIIQVEIKKEIITVNFKDYYTKEIILTKDFRITNETIRDIQTFIEENGTVYYADKVTDYIKDNITIPEPYNMFGW